MKLKKYMIVVICMTVLGCSVDAMAQDAARHASTEAAPSSLETDARVQELTFFNLVKAGGWTMWPLGLCSCLGIGLIVYNAVVIRPQKLLRPDVTTKIENAFSQLDIEMARAACKENPCPVTNIVHAGIERIKGDVLRLSSVEKGMEESSVEEVANHMQPINYLSVIATIAPMLGLLGTVTGMIKAFRAMALGGMGRPELLADNISEALVTTATGLIVGIPIMVAYFYFKNRYTGIVASINRVCGNLLETLESVSPDHEH